MCQTHLHLHLVLEGEPPRALFASIFLLVLACVVHISPAKFQRRSCAVTWVRGALRDFAPHSPCQRSTPCLRGSCARLVGSLCLLLCMLLHNHVFYVFEKFRRVRCGGFAAATSECKLYVAPRHAPLPLSLCGPPTPGRSYGSAFCRCCAVSRASLVFLWYIRV